MPTTYKEIEDLDNPGNARTDLIAMTEDDGIRRMIPVAPGNRHYKEYLVWAETNTIEAFDA